jgi:basic amino acid/polyamine antiporter, APA family
VAAAVPGAQGVWVYLAVALLLLPTGLVFARLGRAFPADGGPYLYAKAAFGSTAAFAVGFTTFVSALFSTATVIVGLVENTATDHASPIVRCLAELGLLTVLSLALSLGLRLSAITWSAVTVLKAAPLVALPIAAIFATTSSAGLPAASPPGLGRATLGAALPVLFALQGFEVVPLPAAQVKNPERNVPLATVGSLLMASLLYVALQASCVRALPDLAAHELPLADAARVYGGATFYRLMVATTSVSALGIVIGMLAMTPRYLAPLGHRDALGFRLDELSARAVPLRAFGISYLLIFVMLVANAMWGSIGNLLALSSLSVTVQYAVTAMALFKLASQRHAGLSPGDRWPVPFALLSCAVLASGSSKLEIPIVAAMVALGILVRWLRQRSRSQ